HPSIEDGIPLEQSVERCAPDDLGLSNPTHRSQRHHSGATDGRIQLTQTITERDSVRVVENDAAVSARPADLKTNIRSTLIRPRGHRAGDLRASAARYRTGSR